LLKVGGTCGKSPLTPGIVVGARGPNGRIEAPGQQGDSAALGGRWRISRPADERNAQNRQRKSYHRPSAEHTRYLPCQPIIFLSHCTIRKQVCRLTRVIPKVRAQNKHARPAHALVLKLRFLEVS